MFGCPLGGRVGSDAERAQRGTLVRSLRQRAAQQPASGTGAVSLHAQRQPRRADANRQRDGICWLLKTKQCETRNRTKPVP